MIDLNLDRDSAVPIAVQVRDGIVRLIRAGVLRRGDRLPTVRQLAEAVAVNRNTIQRIYRDLTADGMLETHVGDGTYVAKAERPESARYRAQARVLIQQAVSATIRLGFRAEEVEAMMQLELAALRRMLAAQGADLVKSRNRFSTWRKYSGAG